MILVNEIDITIIVEEFLGVLSSKILIFMLKYYSSLI